MNVQDQKRPAHEIIIEMIHNEYRELASANARQKEKHAIRIQILCRVMTDMIIPEYATATIASQLEQATQVPILADVANLVSDDIQRLMSRLMHNK